MTPDRFDKIAAQFDNEPCPHQRPSHLRCCLTCLAAALRAVEAETVKSILADVKAFEVRLFVKGQASALSEVANCIACDLEERLKSTPPPVDEEKQ